MRFGEHGVWRLALGASRPATEGPDIDLFGVPAHVILDPAYQLWSEASYISVHRGSERVCEAPRSFRWSASLEEAAVNIDIMPQISLDTLLSRWT